MTKQEYLAIMERELAPLTRSARFDALDRWETKLSTRFPAEDADVYGFPEPEDAAKMEIEATPPLRLVDGWLTRSDDERISLAMRVISMPIWWVAATVLAALLASVVFALWIGLGAVKTLRFILKALAILFVPFAVVSWLFFSRGLAVASAGFAVIFAGAAIVFGAVQDRAEEHCENAIGKTVKFALSLFRKEGEK